MSVSTAYAFTINTTETLESNVPAVAANTSPVKHTAFDEGATLTATTTPPVTKCSYDEVALAAGIYKIDLAALTGTNGLATDLTGLKVQLFRVKNTGASAMTFVGSNTNPYNLCGASFQFSVEPGQIFQWFGNDATPDVAAGAKEIDITGTNTDTFELTVVGG